jgi:membrane peptidoglycan carboxypeptidase
MKELILAFRIERELPKTKSWKYTSTRSFGGGQIHGVETASLYYLVDARDLSIAESASLIGMIQRTELLQPGKASRPLDRKKEQILNRMSKPKRSVKREV